MPRKSARKERLKKVRGVIEDAIGTLAEQYEPEDRPDKLKISTAEIVENLNIPTSTLYHDGFKAHLKVQYPAISTEKGGVIIEVDRFIENNIEDDAEE